MTLNGVMAVTLRYFNEFGKCAFHLITVSSSIELIDQESASITHIEWWSCCALLNSCISGWTLPVNWLTLLTFNLSSKFHFTVAWRITPNGLTLGFRLIFLCSHCNYCPVVQFGGGAPCFVVHVRCRRKESSRSLFHLLMSFLSH